MNNSAVTKKTTFSVKQTALSGLFIAMGIVMPFLTGQIPEIGSMLLPMHLPVLICGYVCGWKYGLAAGVITPLLRSALFGMPPLMPTAFTMAFELAAYGACTGIMYKKLPKVKWAVYASLFGAMIAGRLVWGIVCLPIYGLMGNAFTAQMFLAGAVLNAVPGILLQIVIVPILIIALRKANLME